MIFPFQICLEGGKKFSAEQVENKTTRKEILQ